MIFTVSVGQQSWHWVLYSESVKRPQSRCLPSYQGYGHLQIQSQVFVAATGSRLSGSCCETLPPKEGFTTFQNSIPGRDQVFKHITLLGEHLPFKPELDGMLSPS